MRHFACRSSLLLAAGCASHADRLREVRTQFYQGSVETASITLDKYISNYPREAEAFKLDRAIVELAAGRPKEAEKLLRDVRDALDYNSQASLVEKAGSMLTDDTHTAYAGEDYEKILVRAMLAISNLMNGGADATAYALQVSDMQERIIASGAEGAQENPKLSYKRVALGEYIHGAIDEASRIDYNEAARSYTKVCSWEPVVPLRPLRRRAGNARPPQPAGQRRALCLRPGGARAVQSGNRGSGRPRSRCLPPVRSSTPRPTTASRPRSRRSKCRKWSSTTIP